MPSARGSVETDDSMRATTSAREVGVSNSSAVRDGRACGRRARLVRAGVHAQELGECEQADGDADHAAHLLRLPDAECAQRSPRDDVAPSADRSAVDEGQASVVPYGHDAEDAE